MIWPKTVPVARCWALSAVTSADIDERNDPISLRRFFDEADAALLEHDLGVDEIDFFIERVLQQAGREHGSEHFGFFVGELAAVQQATFLKAARLQAREQQAEAIGDV